jgi:hypothetical protein
MCNALQFEPSSFKDKQTIQKGQSGGKILHTINTVFTVLYSLEFLCKFAAFGKVSTTTVFLE